MHSCFYSIFKLPDWTCPQINHEPATNGKHNTIWNMSWSANIGAYVKGVVNCENSRDKGPPESNSARW